MATDNCPECRLAADYMRSVADVLARGAGGYIGGAIGGPRGAAVGGHLGPEIIERGALGVARAVKKKRSTKQRKRDRAQKRAMKSTQARARTSKGSMKKGWSQSRIMKEMHKECKRLLK